MPPRQPAQAATVGRRGGRVGESTGAAAPRGRRGPGPVGGSPSSSRRARQASSSCAGPVSARPGRAAARDARRPAHCARRQRVSNLRRAMPLHGPVPRPRARARRKAPPGRGPARAGSRQPGYRKPGGGRVGPGPRPVETGKGHTRETELNLDRARFR